MGVGVGLRPPLAEAGSIQIKSNAAINTEQVFFSNIAIYTISCGRETMKEADGKTIRERLPGCYLSWSTYNMRVENIDAALPRKLCNTLLLDLFPKPAAIRDIWKNKLALVEGKRVGAIAATER